MDELRLWAEQKQAKLEEERANFQGQYGVPPPPETPVGYAAGQLAEEAKRANQQQAAQTETPSQANTPLPEAPEEGMAPPARQASVAPPTGAFPWQGPLDTDVIRDRAATIALGTKYDFLYDLQERARLGQVDPRVAEYVARRARTTGRPPEEVYAELRKWNPSEAELDSALARIDRDLPKRHVVWRGEAPHGYAYPWEDRVFEVGGDPFAPPPSPDWRDGYSEAQRIHIDKYKVSPEDAMELFGPPQGGPPLQKRETRPMTLEEAEAYRNVGGR